MVRPCPQPRGPVVRLGSQPFRTSLQAQCDTRHEHRSRTAPTRLTERRIINNMKHQFMFYIFLAASSGTAGCSFSPMVRAMTRRPQPPAWAPRLRHKEFDPPMSLNADDLIWSQFVQFSYNSYSEDAEGCGWAGPHPDLSYKPFLRWDQKLWEDLTRQIVDAGGNQVIFSLGDGIRYDSHPEIAVDGAW